MVSFCYQNITSHKLYTVSQKLFLAETDHDFELLPSRMTIPMDEIVNYRRPEWGVFVQLEMVVSRRLREDCTK